MSIVIATPTGHIGSRLVDNLLAAGADLTLLTRKPERLPESVRNRTNVKQGVLQDPEFVNSATKGADALFWLTPNDPKRPGVAAWYRTMAENLTSAIRSNRIAHVVNLSSGGADLQNAGPVSGLGAIERSIDETDANIIHLRPGSFYENTVMQIGTLKSMGTLFTPVPTDRQIPMIGTADIADAAAPLLLKRDWTGKQIQTLRGPEILTDEQAAERLTEALGRPIKAVQVSAEQMRAGLMAAGMIEEWANALLEMYIALSAPGAMLNAPGKLVVTPMTFKAWAISVLKPMVDA